MLLPQVPCQQRWTEEALLKAVGAVFVEKVSQGVSFLPLKPEACIGQDGESAVGWLCPDESIAYPVTQGTVVSVPSLSH